jgi:hypothetical protein
MRILRSLSISKEPDYPESNEDFFFWTSAGRACAMSDGASESFDSKTWARLLCESFTQTFSVPPPPDLNDRSIRSVLADARRRYMAGLTHRVLTWSQQAALHRGNFASLLGVVEGTQQVYLVAIGDTVALWQDTDGKVHSHVLQEPAAFEKNPVLLSSDARGDAMVFEHERHRWSVLCLEKARIQGTQLFLMTDALGCYAIGRALAGQWTEIEQAFSLPDRDFAFWVSKARLNGWMRRDDTTLAIVAFS